MSEEMRAKIVVQNVYSKIYGVVPDDISEKIKSALQYKVQDYQHVVGNMQRSYAASDWDGTIYLYWPHKGHLFYTGMMSDVLKILDESLFEYVIDDRRIIPARNLADMKLILPPNKSERPYQNIVVSSMIKATRGVMQAATGAGKTFMTTKLIGSIKSGPFLFFVPSVDLLEQSHECLSDCLTTPIGKIGDGHLDIQQVNVVMFQTAVKAVKRNDPKFKVANYKFDDEDKWDDAPLEENRAKAIDSLIRSAAGVYVDECVCGDTMVFTDKGFKRIDEVIRCGCSQVMTYHNGKPSLAAIKNWWNKGKRKTVTVYLSGGQKIKCTPEHLIGTMRGWVQAKKLAKKDLVLCVNAGVEQNFQTEDQCMSSGIRLRQEQKKNGKLNTHLTWTTRHCVDADAEIKYLQLVKIWTCLLRTKGQRGIQNTYMDMTSSETGTNTILSQHHKKNRQYLEHALETLAYNYHTADHETEDYVLTTDSCNSNGLITKQHFCKGSVSKLKSKKILDTGKCGLLCNQNACSLSQKLQKFFMSSTLKESQEKSSTPLEISDSLGGFAMTEVTAVGTWRSDCTPKAGQLKTIKLPKHGSPSRECHAKYYTQKEDRTYHFRSNHHSSCYQKSDNMSQNAWNTNWQTVISIDETEQEDVFDIEVEGTNTFFGNGIFVHNCHHAASQTCQAIMEACSNAYWRYGGSATPFREDGAEKMIQALFGKVVQKISASWLIRNKYLVKPYIFNIRLTGMHGTWKSYQEVYKHYIVENDELNQLVAKLTIKMNQFNIPTLILVQQYPHGNAIKKLVADATFIKGDMARTKRRDAIASLKDGSLPYAIATTLADEGLDVERLGCVVAAGGGKSCSRVYQRIGRVLRKFEGKEKAIVFLFHHDAQFLNSHGNRVLRILKEEPEFVVINSDEKRIMDDINELLQPGNVGLFG